VTISVNLGDESTVEKLPFKKETPKNGIEKII